MYPIGLLGWLVLTRRPAAEAGPADPGVSAGVSADAGAVAGAVAVGQGGIAALGLPAQGGKQSLPASAR